MQLAHAGVDEAMYWIQRGYAVSADPRYPDFSLIALNNGTHIRVHNEDLEQVKELTHGPT